MRITYPCGKFSKVSTPVGEGGTNAKESLLWAIIFLMGSGCVIELFVYAQNVPRRINQKLIKSRK